MSIRPRPDGVWDTPEPTIFVKRPVTESELSYARCWMAKHGLKPKESGPGVSWSFQFPFQIKRGDKTGPHHAPHWLVVQLSTQWFHNEDELLQATAIALAEIRQHLEL